MALVANQAELQAALAVNDPAIEVSASFSISAQININYAVSISSSTTVIHILSRAASYDALLFRVSNGGALNLSRIILDGDADQHPIENTANRSLISLQGGSLLLDSGSVLRNNNSYIEGGGVYLNGQPNYVNTMTMRGDARIVHCYARGQGGGIMVAARNPGDRLTVSDQAYVGGNSASSGGGISFRSLAEGTAPHLILGDQVQFADNVARTANGGGLYFSNFAPENSVSASLRLQGQVSFSGNTAVRGGAVFFNGTAEGDSFIMRGGFVGGNSSSANGGGFHLAQVAGTAHFDIRDAEIELNSAAVGGGIYAVLSAGGMISLSDASFSDNQATQSSSGHGGGIFIYHGSAALSLSVAAERVQMDRNRAAVMGGAFYLRSEPGPLVLNLTDSTITDNIALGNGGGIAVSTAAESALTIKDCIVSNNTSGNFGGGLYCLTTEAINLETRLSQSSFEVNSSSQAGGGICFASGRGTTTVLIEDTAVIGNTVQEGNGGGIWAGGEDSHFILRGSSGLTANTALYGSGGGVYLNAPNGTLRLEDRVVIERNEARDGDRLIHNNGGGIATIYGGLHIDSDEVLIEQNEAESDGGGIYIGGFASAMIEKGTIQLNRATERGGGIFITTGGQLQTDGGRISGNMAALGGGLYIAEFASASLSGETAIGNPMANYAETAAGIYNDGFLSLQDQRNIENGLYIASVEAAQLITAPLSIGSIIQLNNTDYVRPNDQGQPIVVANATAEYPWLSEQDAAAFIKPPQQFDQWEIRLSEDRTAAVLAPIIYHIQYENLRGNANPNPESYTFYSPSFNLLPLPDSGGCRFEGWYDDETDGTLIERVPRGSSGDLILYAHWQCQLQIRFHANASDVSDLPADLSVEQGDSARLPARVPVRAGYRFLGWNTDPDGGGISYQPGEEIEDVQSDIDLYAQWEVLPPAERYWIRFYPNAAAVYNMSADFQAEEGEDTQLPSVVPQYDNYRFLGWNTDPDGGGIRYQPGETIENVQSDIDLYAQWQRIHPEPPPRPPLPPLPPPQPWPRPPLPSRAIIKKYYCCGCCRRSRRRTRHRKCAGRTSGRKRKYRK